MTRIRPISALRLAAATAAILIAAALLPARLGAQSSIDPSDVYLKAYLTMRDAEKLQESGQLHYAYEKYLEATELFDSVAHSYPSWNTQMVSYRRKKIREVMGQLKVKAGTQTAYSPGAAPATADSLAAAPDPVPLPTRSDPLPLAPPPDTAPNLVATIPGAGPPAPLSGDGTSIDVATSHIEAKFAELRTRISQLDGEKQHMVRRLQERESELTSTRSQLEAARAEQEALEARLAESQSRLEQTGAVGPEKLESLQEEIATLNAQLKVARASLAASGAKTAGLLAELEEASAEIELLKEERSQLISERHQMTAIIGEIDTGGSANISRLMALNENLRRQLATARENAEKLAGERSGDKEEIDRLKGEIEGVTRELAQAREDNDLYRVQIAQLTEKLESASQELVENPIELADAPAAEENAMLREIILRQLRQQARRQQSKELVIQELAKLEVNSRSLLDHIEDLAGSRVVFSDKERALFRDSYVAPLLADTDLHGTLITPGSPVEALADPNARVRVPASDPRSQMALKATEASRRFEEGDYAGAEELFEEILNLDRPNVFSLCNLGIVKLRLGKHSEAEVLFNKALAYEPKHALAHFMLGVTQFDQRHLDSAFESITQSVQIDPNNAQAHQYLGLIASHKGLAKRAEEEFKKAIELDPGFAEAHLNLAILYITSPEPVRDLAQSHYLKALDHGAKPDPAIEEYLRS